MGDNYHWEKIEVSEMMQGYEFQLGHESGICHNPAADARRLIVGHSNGVQHIRVRYCECQGLERWQQLIRARLFPSSEERPRSCWTFEFLDTYVAMALQGKIALYDFYLAILHRSHNTSTSNKLVCFQLRCYSYYLNIHQHALWNPLALISRQYIHLKMLKRSGRAHEPRPPGKPIPATEPGSLGVLCPACPQPGMNMPPGWENINPKYR
jgi:hypothetical protein